MRSAWFNFFKQEPWEPGHYLTKDGDAGDEVMRRWDGAAWSPPVSEDHELRWCGLSEPSTHMGRPRARVNNAGQTLKANKPAASVNVVRFGKVNTDKGLNPDAAWPFPIRH